MKDEIITLNNEMYPLLLKEIYDPPSLLFIKGDASLLSAPQLAIVGSRNPTPIGAEGAFSFANHLAQAGLVITSGLAIGIDAAAHRGALAAKGKTIAVVGTGLDRVYPNQHHQLAEQIVECGGLIISEFPIGTLPRPENFPRRNRIISGLSVGTLIVEATLRSGSLITARLALEQGRNIFAIPGSIHNPLARGCHSLIKQGAKLVETAEDILEELVPLVKVSLNQYEKKVPLGLAVEEQNLLHCVGFEPTATDVIIERSGLAAKTVAAVLLKLELEGYISATIVGYQRVKA